MQSRAVSGASDLCAARAEPETSDAQGKDMELFAIAFQRQQLEYEQRNIAIEEHHPKQHQRKLALEEQQLALKTRELHVLHQRRSRGYRWNLD